MTVTPDQAAALARTHFVHQEESTERGVAIDVEYNVGDEIPGEGVVRKATNQAMWIPGIVMMTVGTAVATGGSAAATGIGLTIAGFVPRKVVVEKRLAITPVVGRAYGGGMFELRF